jgi:Mg-chelatase subunit ChlD
MPLLFGAVRELCTFNNEARLLNPLTADRTALDNALTSIATAQLTRIDRGIAVARGALAGPERRPANTAVMIVLTDGRANPVPAAVAVAEAALAKAERIVIFTIGLGSDLDEAALAAMASRPDYFYRAPAAEDLAGIYRAIAVTLPCPAAAFWGRR